MAGNMINRAGAVIEELLGGRKQDNIQNMPPTSNGGRQTCLEKTGMILRKNHIERNEWRRQDIEYTKQLVLSEYLIQTEFKVGEDGMENIKIENQDELTAKKVENLKKKREKIDKQINDYQSKNKKPYETLGK